jgi:hypothetical protein
MPDIGDPRRTISQATESIMRISNDLHLQRLQQNYTCHAIILLLNNFHGLQTLTYHEAAIQKKKN